MRSLSQVGQVSETEVECEQGVFHPKKKKKKSNRRNKKEKCHLRKMIGGLHTGSVVKNSPANVGDMVQSLIQEDPTCCGATRPVYHNY